MTKRDDNPLGVTALYTSQAWIRAGLGEATLFDTRAGWAVYWATTGIYELARSLRPAMAPIQTGLLHRHLMIDHLLEVQDPVQVLELAAGLSARGARYSQGGRRYIEVDLPPVMEAKEQLLGRSARGREVAARGNLKRVAADVTRLDFGGLLEASDSGIGRASGGATGNTLVIAEGLHMYLDVATQRRLWRNVALGLGRCGGGTFVFDHFRRTPSRRPGPVATAVGRVMRTWQSRIGFRPDRRTHKALVRDLGAASFDRVERFWSGDVARPWGLPRPDQLTDVVLYVAHRQGAGS